jgi:hypothetical protein
MHLDQPGNKGSVEPTAALSLRSLLLCLVSQKDLFFTIDLVLAGIEVGFVGLHHLRLHSEFVAEDAY